MTSLKPLPRSFYARDTHHVARALLGKVLVHQLKQQVLSGRIVEVEAYIGEDDLACHASRGRTPRTEIMYGEAGHAYIYLIYGMYYCCNIVTANKNFPAAVLLRALEPLTGIPLMEKNRPHVNKTTELASGPGKLTRALGITKKLNNIDMVSDHTFFVADDGMIVPKTSIGTSSRIGVAYAGPCALYPWRYFIKDSPFVSKQKTATRSGLWGSSAQPSFG